MQEAEERLVANGQEKVCWPDIELLKDKFGLSDQVELGLKLLHPVKLRLLLGTREELERQLDNAEAEEREQLIRSTIAKFDPNVEKLVQRIEQKQDMERTNAAADTQKDGSLDDERATNPEQAAPGKAAGIRVPPHTTQGHHMSVQMPRAQPTANPPVPAARGINGGWLAPRGKGGGKPVPPVAVLQARSRSPRRDDSTWMKGGVAKQASRKGETIRNGKGDWNRVSKSQTDVGNSVSTTSGPATPRNGQNDLQAPTGYSGNDVDMFLVKFKLDAFEDRFRDLGVERLADLKYVTEDDLKGMGMSIIQCRKFREASQSWTEGSQQADKHPPRNSDGLPNRPIKDSKPWRRTTWHEQTAGDEKTDATPRSSAAQKKKPVIGARAQRPQPKHSQKATSAAKHRPAAGDADSGSTQRNFSKASAIAQWSATEELSENSEQDGKALPRWSSEHWHTGDEASWSW